MKIWTGVAIAVAAIALSGCGTPFAKMGNQAICGADNCDGSVSPEQDVAYRKSAEEINSMNKPVAPDDTSNVDTYDPCIDTTTNSRRQYCK